MTVMDIAIRPHGVRDRAVRDPAGSVIRIRKLLEPSGGGCDG
jgi:hypothetical protein